MTGLVVGVSGRTFCVGVFDGPYGSHMSLPEGCHFPSGSSSNMSVCVCVCVCVCVGWGGVKVGPPVNKQGSYL